MNLPELSSQHSKRQSPQLLDERFFTRPCLEVARNLLGKTLIRRVGRAELVAELVEVEAYLGLEDPASHAYRRKTARNNAMFERGGACYVYLSYGMCFCMNVVTGPEGRGEAVLLRAAVPLAGIEMMRKNRRLPVGAPLRSLLSGPGKLAQAFGVDLAFSGQRFNQGVLLLADIGTLYSDEQVSTSGRIGISKAKDLPYRFSVRQSPFLSRRA